MKADKGVQPDPFVVDDFEVDIGSYVGTTSMASVKRDTLRSHSGKTSLKLVKNGASSLGYALKGVLDLKPNATYKLIGWSYQTASNNIFFRVGGTKIVGAEVSSTSKNTSKKWIQHSLTFETMADILGATIQLSPLSVPNAVVWWDDVVLQEVVPNEVRKAIRRSYSIDAGIQLIAEWNYNRYVKTTVDSAVGEKEFGLAPVKFPITSITEPRRPGQGLVKARVGQGRGRTASMTKAGIVSDGYNDNPNQKKSYVSSEDDIYKYWTSHRPATQKVSGKDEWRFLNKYDNAVVISPIVYYNSPVKANKIVVQFEATYARPADFTVELRNAGTLITPAMNFTAADLKKGRLELYYKEDGTWGQSKTFARNAPDSSCTKLLQSITLKIRTMDKDEAFCDIIEVGARLERNLTNDVVSITSDSELSDESPLAPLGKASSNTSTITLNNTNFRYTRKNNLYYGMTDYGVKFTNTYLYNVDGHTYKVRDFEMYSDSAWAPDDLSMSVSLRDYSLFLQDIKPRKVLFDRISVGKAVWRLCDHVGFNNYNYNRPADKKTTNIDWFWTTEEQTVWEIFAELSEITQTAIFFDGYGQLQIKTREELYDETATPVWTFRGETEGPLLADVISTSADRTFNSNKINVNYQPTDVSDWRNGYPKLSEAWAPEEETVVVRATPLRSSLARKSNYIKIGKDDAKIWPYKSFIQVDAEIMEYDGKGYNYYDKDGKRRFVVINSAEELKKIRDEKSSENLKHKNHFTGALRLVNGKRGLWGTDQRKHVIDIKGWHLSYASAQLTGLTVWGSGDSKPKKKKKKKKKLQGFVVGGSSGGGPKRPLTGFTARDNDPASRRVVGQIQGFDKDGTASSGSKPKNKKKKHANGVWDPIKGKKKKGVGRINQVAGESHMRIQTAAKFATNQRFFVRRGKVTDRALRHLGCRMRFNKGDFKDQKAGIMFNSKVDGTANYVELTPTKFINAKQQKKKGEVVGYQTDGFNTEFQIGGPNASIAIIEGQWYDVDIDWSNNSGYHQFDVYINGSLRISETIPPGISIDPSGMFGMFARGHTSVDVEYFYAFNRNFATVGNDHATFYDKINGGYVEDRFWREWVWNTATMKQHNHNNPGGLLGGFDRPIGRGSQYFFDEFGAIVREIRKFDVNFEKPQQYTELFFDNEEEVMCPSYYSDSFEAHFFLVNTKRENVVVNGEDTRQWNGESVNRVLKVFGRTVEQQEEKIETVQDDNMIRRRGVIETDINSPWIQSETEAKSLGNWLKDRISRDFNQYTLEVFGNPLLELGDIVRVKHKEVQEPTDMFIITALNQSWDNGLATSVTLRRVVKGAII